MYCKDTLFSLTLEVYSKGVLNLRYFCHSMFLFSTLLLLPPPPKKELSVAFCRRCVKGKMRNCVIDEKITFLFLIVSKTT